jgi:hypothetical protein
VLETVNKAIVTAERLADECVQAIAQDTVPTGAVCDLELSVDAIGKFSRQASCEMREIEVDLIELQQSVRHAITTAEEWLIRTASELEHMVSHDRLRRAYRVSVGDTP